MRQKRKRQTKRAWRPVDYQRSVDIYGRQLVLVSHTAAAAQVKVLTEKKGRPL